MSSVVKFVIVLSGALLLFNFFGLIENTASSVLLGMLLNPESISNSSFVTLGVTAAIVIAGALTVNPFTSGSSKTDMFILAIMMGAIVSWGWDILAIYRGLGGYIPLIEPAVNVSPLPLLICSPLLIAYIIIAVNWWSTKKA